MPDDPTLEDYIAWLDDDDPDVRRNAAWVLGRQRDIRIVEPLIAALDDENADVRLRVVEALGTIKDPRVIDPLIEALDDPEAEVRAYAAGSLGSVPDDRSIEPLIAALKDDAALVRAAVAGALGRIPDGRAIQPLLTVLLHDADNDVLDSAAKSLANVGGAGTVDALLVALDQTDDAGILIYIIEILVQLFDRRAIQPLQTLGDHPDEGVRETANWALRQLEK